MTSSLGYGRILDAHLAAMQHGPTSLRPPADLLKAVERVRLKYGLGQASLVTRSRVEAAVTDLLRGGEPSRRQLFVLSHALAQRVDTLGGGPLLDSALGDRLLSTWEASAGRDELLSFHWRGLFHSYLQAPVGAGCDRLRRLLAHSLGSLGHGLRTAPHWLTGIRRHQGLLGDDPAGPYVRELISGSSSELDDLLSSVDVPAASWFWAVLREVAVEHIASLDETSFRQRLEHLLSLPERIPNARDDILAAVLERYARCADRSRHLPLMEAALDAWGSPQLTANRLWTLAGEGARQMVCGWLAQEDLEDFYRLCQSNRQVDDRRLQFWLQFKEQMGYTQILLGRYLDTSRDQDTRDFKKMKRGRIGELTSGPATNNAILMQVGGWLFIEFSETGNACYAFPIAGAPLELGRRQYSLGQLKPRDGKRLLHMDGHLSWEQKFIQEISRLGIAPDAASAVASSTPSRTQRHAAQGTVPPRISTVPERYTTGWGGSQSVAPVGRIVETLELLGVRIVDHRAKGGALWAYSDNRPGIDAKLKALGMKYNARNGGFYLP